MAATITEKMVRLGLMLQDASPEIKNVYVYTIPNIDDADKPCWVIFHDDTSVDDSLSAPEQAITNSTFSMAFIGETFRDSETELSIIYEQKARNIHQATLEYLLSHQQMEMSNKSGRNTEALRSLEGVQLMTLGGGLSGVTLFTREAVNGSFWGFTCSVSVREQLAYTMAG